MKENDMNTDAHLRGTNARKPLRRKAAFTLFFAFCAVGLRLPVGAQESRFSAFRAPGAGTASGQGTSAVENNEAGETIGYYFSADWGRYAFLRGKDGHTVTFTPPGSCGTTPNSINASGAISGTYLDPDCYSFHGFLRDPGGAITAFDVPGAGTGNNQGTCWYGCSINNSGTIAGNWVDPSGISHGFLRNPSGAYTTFDPPGSAFTSVPWPSGIGATGAVSGNYLDANGVSHGFLRTPDGTIQTFDAPGAGTLNGQGTFNDGMNQWGTSVGAYIDMGSVGHGFLRDLSGRITTFDIPGAGASSGQGTYPNFLNASGEIVGAYWDANWVQHGFAGIPGSFTIIDAPGAGTEGTYASAVNVLGVITGSFVDANGVSLGFLQAP